MKTGDSSSNSAFSTAEIISSGDIAEEMYFHNRLPRTERFTVCVDKTDGVVSVTYQPPCTDVGNPAILLSPGFTAGETAFELLHRALAEQNYASFSLSHHRRHDSAYSIQQTHAINDKKVLQEAFKRYGYTRFIVVGWSMGGGDAVHMVVDSNCTMHDVVERIVLLESMGLVANDTLPAVAGRMARSVALDAQLFTKLPLQQKRIVGKAAIDSAKRAVTNVRQTHLEATYAASVDIRELTKELIKNGMRVDLVTAENDIVFDPREVYKHTQDIAFDRRVIITGRFATHTSGLLVPRATAASIVDEYVEAA